MPFGIVGGAERSERSTELLYPEIRTGKLTLISFARGCMEYRERNTQDGEVET